MAKDSSCGFVKIGSCGDYSTSYVPEQQQKGLGGMLAQGGGTAERCTALLLPREVSRRVFCQLDYRDLVQCSLVCKQWNLEATELRRGWKSYWKSCCWLENYRQWYLESTELRQGWKEELYWEARSVRGVHFTEDNAQPRLPLRFELHLAGRPD